MAKKKKKPPTDDAPPPAADPNDSIAHNSPSGAVELPPAGKKKTAAEAREPMKANKAESGYVPPDPAIEDDDIEF